MTRRIQRLTGHLAAVLPRNARVLDVGAGSGDIAWMINQIRPDLTIEGIDVLVRPNTRIPVRAFDGKTIPAADASWDVCMFVDVLHHCDDPAASLREAARVARHAIVIKDHQAANALDHRILRFMDWFGNRGHNVVLPYNYWSPIQWRDAFESLGLRAEVFNERLHLYPFPFTFLFDRRLHFISRLVR
jgi:SAM-dependent methyltransferase